VLSVSTFCYSVELSEAKVCLCAKHHCTAQVHFVCVSAWRGIVKDYPHIQKTWEGTILLFPGGKARYNFLWQYLVVLPCISSLFFPLFLESLSYSFQGKSVLQTMMSCWFVCPVYWPAKNPVKNRCDFLINVSIKTLPQGDLRKVA